MSKPVATALFLFLVAPYTVFAQKALSLSFGFPKIGWDYEGNFDGLRTVYRNGWSITLSGHKITQKGVVYGIDVGVNRYGNGFQYDKMRFDIKEIHHFAILPFIGYEHNIKGTKFSTRAILGGGLGIVPIENMVYEEDKTFQIRYTGNGVPLYNLIFSGSQKVESRVFPLFKPSLELHFATGEKSTIFIKGTLGISLVEAVIMRDFPEVIYESEVYNVTHTTSLSYSSLEIGYSYRFK